MRITLVVVMLCAAQLILLVSCKPSSPGASAPAPTNETPRTIFDIIAGGDTTGFIHWIEDAPRLESRDTDQSTPLIAAIRHGRIDYAVDLIGHGANVAATDRDGATPLHVAAALGNTAALSLLIESGADLQSTNADGLAAYDVAVLFNQQAAAATLAEARLALMTPVIIEPEPETIVEAPPIPEAVLLSTDFRIWTSSSGTQLEAAYIQHIFDTLVLQDRQGKFFRIPMHQLSPADQITARTLAGTDPHALAKARGTRQPASIRPAQDSIARKIGRGSEWTVLENCRLLKSSSNDGDSFHVKHDDKEYIFRLYFVDSAETSMAYPERVREQASYFGISDSDAIKLGESASKFTASLLAAGPFTVVTAWEDARGNSRLPRHYGMVITGEGDLDELLVREGLARRFGMTVKNDLGSRKLSTLKRIEQEAKDQKNGAWGRQKNQTAGR